MAIMRGICRFCGVGEDQLDGDKLSWLDDDHTCCSGYACVKQWGYMNRAALRKPRKHGDRFVGLG